MEMGKLAMLFFLIDSGATKTIPSFNPKLLPIKENGGRCQSQRDQRILKHQNTMIASWTWVTTCVAPEFLYRYRRG
jgi:hypothetical protein